MKQTDKLWDTAKIMIIGGFLAGVGFRGLLDKYLFLVYIVSSILLFYAIYLKIRIEATI